MKYGCVCTYLYILLKLHCVHDKSSTDHQDQHTCTTESKCHLCLSVTLTQHQRSLILLCMQCTLKLVVQIILAYLHTMYKFLYIV